MKKLIFLIILLFAITGSQASPFFKPSKHKLMKRMTRTEVIQVAAGKNLYSHKNGEVVRNKFSWRIPAKNHQK
jgi:hypothetical protein